VKSNGIVIPEFVYCKEQEIVDYLMPNLALSLENIQQFQQ